MSAAVAAPAGASSRPRLWRVTDRGTFAELRRRGRRVRHGALSVTYLPDTAPAATPPRVAFVIGKAAGGAVVRNRIRRRIRAALQALVAAGRLPAGTYLWGAGPAAASLDWSTLEAQVGHLVDEVTR